MVKLKNFDTHVNEKPKRRSNDFLDEDYRMLIAGGEWEWKDNRCYEYVETAFGCL